MLNPATASAAALAADDLFANTCAYEKGAGRTDVVVVFVIVVGVVADLGGGGNGIDVRCNA